MTVQADHPSMSAEGTMQRCQSRVGPSREREGRTTVKITVLGDFRVAVDGVPTPASAWSRRSAAILVKVLALAPGHSLHREQVMDLLWPHESPDRSAPRLHKAAYFARRVIGCDDAVVLRDDVVYLFPGAEVTVDAVRFEQLARVAVREGDPVAARAALAWYRGELLPGDRYEEWAADRREMLHLRHVDVLRVAGEWRELVELDPTDEEARAELMRRHLEAGDGAAALHEYQHLERALDGEPGRPARVGSLLSELAGLVSRQRALIAELDALGVSRPPPVHLGVVA
jgi:DNA-binding SARP family transcriptional activator